ncbi:MAG: hypothetical protein ACM3UV_08285 [Nocardioidaceae bacterium]
MHPVEIVVIVVAAIVAIVFVGGLLAVRRRTRRQAGTIDERIAAADHALEEARAADRGWDREALERAARVAVGDERPAFTLERLDLVLVDDRPGVEEDRAHFVAAGPAGELQVVLARRDGGWVAERVS